MGAMADAEDEISFRQRDFEKRSKGGGVGGKADAKIDVRSDDTRRGNFFSEREANCRAG